MICINCMKEKTKCIDDMIQQNYTAEIYRCKKCKGIIEVVYKSSNISKDNIKTYRYISK